MGNDLAGKVYGCLEAEVDAVTSLEEVEEEVLFEYNRKRRETGIVGIHPVPSRDMSGCMIWR